MKRFFRRLLEDTRFGFRNKKIHIKTFFDRLLHDSGFEFSVFRIGLGGLIGYNLAHLIKWLF